MSVAADAGTSNKCTTGTLVEPWAFDRTPTSHAEEPNAMGRNGHTGRVVDRVWSVEIG